jgi:hypothetical protein
MGASISYHTFAVVNEAYGGFWLSDEAAHEMARRKGLVLERRDGLLYVRLLNRPLEDLFPRNDPDMVAVVQVLGSTAASAPGSKLVVKKIKVEVEISNHDGYERIGTAYAIVEPNG